MNETTPPPPDVIVLPGVPNMAGLTVDNGSVPFPDSSTDFVKVLRERGMSVEFAVAREQRTYVGHKAFELWLPILEFSIAVLANLEAGILVELLKAYIEPQPTTPSDSAQVVGERPALQEPETTVAQPSPPILHVEWHVARSDGGRESFVANGSATEVLEALERFEQHVRDDDGS